MQKRILSLVVLTAAASGLPDAAFAIQFFSEDFESYTSIGDVTTVGNPGTGTPWTISHTSATVENEADWLLVDTKTVSFLLGGPAEYNIGPTTDGGGTTPGYDHAGNPVPPVLPPPTGPPAGGGLYMISASDGIQPNTQPFSPGGSVPDDPALPDEDTFDSRINNGTYTGASNDMITPSFSTVGASGDVWLHASVSSVLGDNGQAIFDIDVSTDGGANWTNHYRRIAPGTGRDFASGDFDQDLDVDGFDFLHVQREMNFTDAAGSTAHEIDSNRRNTDQRWSDWEKAIGKYTPVVATVADGNAGGTQGELDINLGAIGGNSDVKVRFRHFEQRDDETIAIDNIRVDEVSPEGSEAVTIFSEDFNTMTLGSMDVYTLTTHPFNPFFPADTGGGSGTLSGHSWGAQDRDSVEFPTGRYNAGQVSGRGVNHLGHSVAEGAMGQVPFAIIDPKAEEDNVGAADNVQAERLHTPLLDLSGHSNVILEWDDEGFVDGNPLFGTILSVVVMEDDDGTAGPSEGDTILADPDKLSTTFANPYLPYDKWGGGYGSDDESAFQQIRLDITSIVNTASDKTKLYIAWQHVNSDTQYWAIDNILITGDGVPPSFAAVTTPEPSTLMLILFGVPAFATVRRRVRVR